MSVPFPQIGAPVPIHDVEPKRSRRYMCGGTPFAHAIADLPPPWTAVLCDIRDSARDQMPATVATDERPYLCEMRRIFIRKSRSFTYRHSLDYTV